MDSGSKQSALSGNPGASDGDGLERVRERNAWYRDRYRFVLRLAAGAVALSILLALALIALALRPPPAPAYFATAEDGRLVPLSPVSEPYLAPGHLTQWAADVAVQAHAYSFSDWRERLNALRGPLDDKAFEDFLRAVESSRNLEAVRTKRLVVSAVAQAPVITAHGVLGGRYTWRVEVPLSVTYQSASEKVNQSVVAVMRIQRVPVTRYPRGVQVTQIVVRPR